MPFQPSVLTIQFPEWIHPFLRRYPAHFPSLEARMSLVIEAARLNVTNATVGPFAAAVFETGSGKLLSLGVNLVTSAGLSILHAEMVALVLAQTKLGSYDLGGPGLPAHELVTSAEPCAMCLGAIPWSGVRRLVTGARDGDVRAIGFDEGPKTAEWRAELEQRGIAVIRDVERDAAIRVLRDYSLGGGTIYNSREQG